MAKKDFFKAFMAYKYFTKKKETENQDSSMGTAGNWENVHDGTDR